jgi:hypothetical protein
VHFCPFSIPQPAGKVNGIPREERRKTAVFAGRRGSKSAANVPLLEEYFLLFGGFGDTIE